MWGREGVRGEGGACEREVRGRGMNLFTTIRQRHPRRPPAIPPRLRLSLNSGLEIETQSQFAAPGW